MLIIISSSTSKVTKETHLPQQRNMTYLPKDYTQYNLPPKVLVTFEGSLLQGAKNKHFGQLVYQYYWTFFLRNETRKLVETVLVTFRGLASFGTLYFRDLLTFRRSGPRVVTFRSLITVSRIPALSRSQILFPQMCLSLQSSIIGSLEASSSRSSILNFVSLVSLQPQEAPLCQQVKTAYFAMPPVKVVSW